MKSLIIFLLSFTVVLAGGSSDSLKLKVLKTGRLYADSALIPILRGNVDVRGTLGVDGSITCEDSVKCDFIQSKSGNNSLTLFDDNLITLESQKVNIPNILDVKQVEVDSLKLGSGDWFKTYKNGSFPCTLKVSDVTVQQIGTAFWTKIGNVFTCSFPQLGGTSNSSSMVLHCIIPYFPKQLVSGYGYNKTSITVIDNGTVVNATAILSTNPTLINKIYFNVVPGALFTSSGTKSFSPFTINYITEE